ncbi:MAG: phosphatase family protein [Hymenobacter sp.]|nr:phosphatase family protein [Hymenobacter sp.]
MNTIITLPRAGVRAIVLRLLVAGAAVVGASCSDSNPLPEANPSPDASTYPADVALTWTTLQLKLARTTPVIAANVFGRPFGYIGIAGYEAAVPGMAGHKSLAGQLNGLNGLPAVDKRQAYSWPLSTNAALAGITRGMFANTSPANLATIDSLEAANKAQYQASLSPEIVSRSAEFGKKVAAAVFEWSKTDGYNNPAVYTAPTGPGMWVPTPPAFGAPIFPFWGSNRLLVAGSTTNAEPGPPPAYSTAPNSPFYLMAKEVRDIGQTRTADQTAIALFWNDAANGRSFTTPGHWISILAQVLAKEQAPLDKALEAYAKLGICMNDASVCMLKDKYIYNLVRPVTYMRSVLGEPTWNSLISTPPHPEYPSGHSTVSGASAEMLTEIFGANYAFTDRNYAQFGLGTRSFSSFEQAATEAGLSRVYGGIHYRLTCEISQAEGKKIAQNIKAKLSWR